MNPRHLEPARSIVAKLGVETVAEVTGKHVSRVYRWMAPKERGGTDGFIPYLEAQKLLEWARANDKALSPAEFFAPAPAEAAE